MYDSREGRGRVVGDRSSDGVPGRTSDVTGWHGCAGRGGAPGIDERRDAGGGVVDGEGNEPPPLPTSTSTSTSTAMFRSEGYANRKVHFRKTASSEIEYTLIHIILITIYQVQGVINYTMQLMISRGVGH